MVESRRIALGIEYDGHEYCGWQIQKHDPNSVQEVLEKALSTVADHSIRVICAGRTDTGVHATEQVVHFETTADRSERSWVYGANRNLPKSVCVLWARPVDKEFHARFSARRRRYLYVIFNREVRPTYLAYRTTWEYRPLDENRMHEAAQVLVGEHDFNAYRALGCQAKSPVRTVHHLNVFRKGPYVFIDIEANAFLHHMVRNIAGVLMDIGAGKQPVQWAREVLETRDRTLGGITAPPYGLYLSSVQYEGDYNIPSVPPALPVW